MKLADFLSQFTVATGDIKKELSAANATIKALTVRLEKAEADDEGDSAELDKVLEQLREILNEKAGSDSDDSDSDSDSDSSDSDSDSDQDDADDDNDETDAKSKASTKQDKVKAVAAKTKKLVAEHKKLKASVPKQVIRTIASMGIPEPVKTKVEGEKPQLKGLARTSAAFAEQFSK